MAKLILGIAGEMGSGKGSIAKYVEEKYKGASHRFSTVMREILSKIFIQASRENMSALSLSLRETFGEDVFAKGMAESVNTDPSDIVVVDGIRRVEDIVHLTLLPHFKLIYVDANLEKRYERIVNRNENSNDDHKSFEQFKQEHQLDTEQRVPKLKEYSHYVVDNNGTFEELYEQIDSIISKELEI